MRVWSLGWEDLLEKGMATHSSILAWRIPWTEEPGGLRSIGPQRVGHDWSDLAHTHSITYIIYLVSCLVYSLVWHLFSKNYVILHYLIFWAPYQYSLDGIDIWVWASIICILLRVYFYHVFYQNVLFCRDHKHIIIVYYIVII